MTQRDYPEDYLREILLAVKTIALVGISKSDVRPSNLVLRYLLGKGYQVFPVNPGLAGQELFGATIYASLGEIPDGLDMVDIFRNSQAAGPITDAALALDPLPKVIWMQLGVENEEAARRAEARGVKVVMNRCPKMEYGKLSGEWAWVGGASGMLSSRRQKLHESGRLQSLGLLRR